MLSIGVDWPQSLQDVYVLIFVCLHSFCRAWFLQSRDCTRRVWLVWLAVREYKPSKYFDRNFACIIFSVVAKLLGRVLMKL